MTLDEVLAPRAQPVASFEIWFAVLRDLASGRALWVRRSHLRTTGGRHGSVVWAALYDSGEPRRHADAGALFDGKAPSDELGGGQGFGAGKLSGRVSTARGPLEWSLDWQPELPPHRMGPLWLADSPIVKTKTVVAAPRAKFQGAVTLGGERLPFERARGLVYHIWGTQRALDLRWVYVPAFDGDEEGWAMEFVSVRPSASAPWLTWATLTREGGLWCTQGLWQMLRGRSGGSLPELRLSARGGDFKVDARATLDRDQLTSYLYRDPGGRPTYIAHRDTSAIDVTLDFGGRRRQLRCARNAAVEFHGPAPWAGGQPHDPYSALFTP